jgi:hypothetical protein
MTNIPLFPTIPATPHRTRDRLGQFQPACSRTWGAAGVRRGGRLCNHTPLAAAPPFHLRVHRIVRVATTPTGVPTQVAGSHNDDWIDRLSITQMKVVAPSSPPPPPRTSAAVFEIRQKR